VSDSAGVPWAGRHFEANAASDDDGSAPEALIEAIQRFRAGDADESEVVDAIRVSRLLVPLVAELGDRGVSSAGYTVDKSQELSIVTVAGPDGRNVLPAFSSVTAMSTWNRAARPVPAAGTRVALAAVSESTELVVLDPTSETEFVIRRPALWAIAQSQPWTPSYRDPDVLQAFMDAAAPEPAVLALTLGRGDPAARLVGPELLVRLALTEGLNRASLDAVVARLHERWTASATITDRVDSIKVQLSAV
jgi:hypothetical protein